MPRDVLGTNICQLSKTEYSDSEDLAPLLNEESLSLEYLIVVLLP